MAALSVDTSVPAATAYRYLARDRGLGAGSALRRRLAAETSMVDGAVGVRSRIDRQRRGVARGSGAAAGRT